MSADPRSDTLTAEEIAAINARVLASWRGYTHGASGPDDVE